MDIKILIADDHKIVSECLTPLLNKEPDMEVVAEAGNGRDAIELVQRHNPSIVIMDISMPELNGIEATRQITSHHPKVKVIALSMNTDKRYVKGVLGAGASGYLTKGCSFEELTGAIRVVVAGKIFLSPEISGVIVEESLTGTTLPSPFPPSLTQLTAREREVLQLLAEGKSVKEIAERLYVSIKTVHTHRVHIMKKLKIKTIAGLTKYAIREGLTSLE